MNKVWQTNLKLAVHVVEAFAHGGFFVWVRGLGLKQLGILQHKHGTIQQDRFKHEDSSMAFVLKQTLL